MTKNNHYKKALNYCLRLLLHRDQTRWELERKITKKGYEEVKIDVINQLITWGYLDDKKYAENYIRSKINIGRGKNKICYELLKKGISKDIITDAYNNCISKENEKERLNEIASKKAISLFKRYPPEIVYNKLFLFLIRRGYAIEDIRCWFDVNFEAFLDNITNKL